MNKSPCILVIDSGIGGLSVYDEIKIKIPNANYIYLFDNEGFPYGDKSDDFLIDRVYGLIKNVLSHYQVDIIVIACNTASTICLPFLRKNIDIPIVGVVPAIKPAIAITKNKVIGLLATKATVNREYTKALIRQFAADAKIISLGLSELAIMAEQKIQGQKININELKQLMQPFLNQKINPDTIILGCTHYPFLKDEFKMIFKNVNFVDSGEAIALRVNHLLSSHFDLSEQSNKNQKVICSSLYNNDVKITLNHLAHYCFDKYQQIKI